jgi:hypothetical protein
LLVLGVLILGFAAGALWMHAHETCGTCQHKGQAMVNGLRRKLGMALIPNE